ncbi:hypothetical protein EVAR_24198_1 [Eumeta japonica]|uniref:Uncharacterized protein n=1 Tax=Eumeta variegata TaxID=151549 RepID=A0A4C1W783_EUMVA|nr:hypothetical protein EVAR_24198_1 [Eumeta japonica]
MAGYRPESLIYYILFLIKTIRKIVCGICIRQAGGRAASTFWIDMKTIILNNVWKPREVCVCCQRSAHAPSARRTQLRYDTERTCGLCRPPPARRPPSVLGSRL